jgi:hypothetical protein
MNNKNECPAKSEADVVLDGNKTYQTIQAECKSNLHKITNREL